MPDGPLGVVALGTHLACRLAYVLYIGIALRREERERWFTRRYGTEEGFRRFRRLAAAVMTADAVTFIVLVLVTRGMLDPVLLVVGAGLVVLGLGTKLWAARTLGSKAYYWYDFFAPAEPLVASAAGPYRFLANPMYSVGYFPAYGFALALGSLVGLGAALFDHVAILVFYRLVERPHFARRARPPVA